MKFSQNLRLIGVVCAIANLGNAASAAETSPSVVRADPLQIFGSSPIFQGARISPDGSRLAVIMPATEPGYEVVGIMHLDDPNATLRRISIDGDAWYLEWGNNERLLVGYTHGFNGGTYVVADHEFAIIDATRDSGTVRIMAGEGIVAPVAGDSESVLITGANWTHSWQNLGISIYEADLYSGYPTVAFRGVAGTAAWFFGNNQSPVLRVDIDQWSTHDVLFVPDGDDDFRQLTLMNDTPDSQGYITGITPDGESAAVLARRESDRTGLYRLDLDTGEWGQPLYAPSENDVIGALKDDVSKTVIGVTIFDQGALRPIYFSPEHIDIQEAISTALGGKTVWIISRDISGNRFLLSAGSSSAPSEYYIFEVSTSRLVPLGSDYPDVPNLPPINVTSYGYAALDGSQITGMLFTPPDVTEALPAIVFPSGASGFEEGNFNWLAQYFARKGYAVLHSGARQIRSFGEVSGMEELGNWVRQEHEDIGSGVEALAAEGIVDPERVCVLGYGFDGYLATIGVAVAQDRYACIVSLFGIADLEDYIWEMRYSYYGFSILNNDVIRYRRDYDEAELRRYSPHTYVDAFNVPVMFVEERHASTQTKTEDLAEDIRRAGKSATYLEMRQDVDVFSAERRTTILREVDAFLAAHIGN